MYEFIANCYGDCDDDEIHTFHYIDLYYINDLIKFNIKNITEWECECCNKKVKYENTRMHLKSKKHIKNYEPNNKIIHKWFYDNEGDFNKMTFLEIYNIKLLVEEAIKKDKNEKEFYCGYCDKTLKKTSLIQHLKNDEHIESFTNRNYEFNYD